MSSHRRFVHRRYVHRRTVPNSITAVISFITQARGRNLRANLFVEIEP